MIEELKYTLKNIANRKLRSFLTVLSILIGITSIFALVSFGLGIDKYINDIGEEAGTDILYIMARGIGAPGTDDNFFITQKEIDFVDKLKGVKKISGMYLKPGEILFRNQKRYAYVIGMDMKKVDWLEKSFTVGILKGRHVKKGELAKVTLGHNYQLDEVIFKRGLKTGDKVQINDKYFDVVGFWEEIGNPADDSNIYMTNEAMEVLYEDLRDKFGYVIAQSDRGVDPSKLAEKIEEKLRKYNNQEEGEEKFYVQTYEDALSTFTAIIDVLNGVLILIALISLIVAAVNIINTMYTTVLERTKEIGVMKSIGAQNHKILSIFVFESGFLGLIGGVFGIFFGYIIAKIGGSIAIANGYSSLQPTFPWYLIVGCLLFSLFIGLVSGLWPARKASRLKPVDALRYE